MNLQWSNIRINKLTIIIKEFNYLVSIYWSLMLQFMVLEMAQTNTDKGKYKNGQKGLM